MYYCYFDTPIGELLLAGEADSLEMIGFPKGAMRRDPEPDWIYKEEPFDSVLALIASAVIIVPFLCLRSISGISCF